VENSFIFLILEKNKLLKSYFIFTLFGLDYQILHYVFILIN
jgi:hypothetical protein